MTNEVKTKSDNELLFIIIVLGIIFTGTLTAIDIFYGNMSGLMNSWAKWPFIVLHVLALIQWFVVIKTKDQPNMEWCRWTLAVTLIAAILLVMSHRSGWLGDNGFQEDVQKNKTEKNVN